jgi:mRNA interferase MazF
MNIRQGDIFWISPNKTNGIASDHAHPHVVIQDDISNKLMVCAITSNLKRAKEPGNVLLDESEANLTKQSVVVVSQVSIVDKTQLGKYIGTLTEKRINQVLAGIRFLEFMTQHHEPMTEREGDL